MTQTVLGGSAIFRGLTADTVRSELLRLGARRRSVSPGHLLAAAGDRYDRLFLVLSGELEATVQEHDGRSMRVATLRAPEAVAPGILFSRDPRLPVSLRAVRRTELLDADRAAVVELCRIRSAFLLDLLSLLGERIQYLSAALRTARWSTIEGRLAAYLLEQVPARGARQLRLVHSREEIAALLGTQRPSVSRTLSAMASRGLIRCRGREVLVLDPEALRRTAVRRGRGGRG